MKKCLLVLTLTLTAYFSKAQIAASDAVTLSKFIKDTAFSTDPADIETIVGILRNYVVGIKPEDPATIEDIITLIKDTSAANKDYNPFLAKYFTTGSGQAGTAAKLLRKGASAVGNIDVTNFADGLAKFLVERVKEELSVAFFNQFKNDMQDERYSDLHILFPQTKLVLETIDEKIYQFSAYLTELRDAFIVDLNHLPYNCPLLIDQPKYAEFFTRRPFYKTILRLGSLTASLLLKDAKNLHPGEIIEKQIDADKFFNLSAASSAIDTNINASIKTLQFLSRSLRWSADDSRYWLGLDSLSGLFTKTGADMYLGLLLGKSRVDPPIIYSGNKTLSQVLLGVGNTVQAAREMVYSISRDLQSIDRNFQAIQEIKAAIKDGVVKDSIYRYQYALYTSALDLLQKGLSLTDQWKLNITPKVDKYINSLKSLGDVYINVNQEKYGLAILSVINLANNVLDSANAILNIKASFKKTLLKLSLYGTFVAEVANAESSDEVKEIIAKTVLPTGSSYIKKQSRFNISLNAYTGLYYGQQRQATDKEFVSIAGVYAPVGLAFSWGVPRADRKKSPWSITAFASIIDVGPLVAYRFSNYNDTLANDVNIRLAQIVSPGGHLIIGIPKLPLSIGGGFNWSPLITKVEKESLTTQPNDKRPFRWQIFAAVDIPFFNFFNKPR